MDHVIVFGQREYDTLRDHLFSDTSCEQAAFLLATSGTTETMLKLLVREVLPLGEHDFIEHEALRLVIQPAALAWSMKRAARENASLIMVHTHPFATDTVAFSPVDDVGEAEVFTTVARRVPNRVHASMVFGQSSAAARFWYGSEPVSVDRIVVTGSRLLVSTCDTASLEEETRYDRQVRAFGVEGQRRLSQLHVGVVGCGGTGSAVAEQLLRLGVGHILIVDPDVVEESNITRIYGSTASDAITAVAKVEVVRRLATNIVRSAAVEVIPGDVRDTCVARQLIGVDVLFGCTDSHWSRLVLNQLAERYLIPLIDLGTRIDGLERPIPAVVGRISFVLPGSPCLFCSEVIRPELIAAEALPTEERAKLVNEGYIRGLDERAPSVISINTVVAGLAVTQLLQIVTGWGAARAGQLVYDASAGTVRTTRCSANPACWCSTGAEYARGDALPLSCRLLCRSSCG